MKLNLIDLFGSQTQFRFRGKQTYKTIQGAVFTGIIATIVVLRLIYIIYDIYQRKDPFVIFKERQVSSPAPFHMTNSTIQFAFGMQNASDFKHYIDLSVYNITVKQVTKKMRVNITTQKKEFYYETTQVKVSTCTEESFQNLLTRDYFLNLDYKNLMCIDPNQEMLIEGDYGVEKYSYFSIRATKCTRNCNPQIDKLLEKAFFAIYFSDVLIDPQERDDPFKYYTRDNYWMTSDNAPRDVSFQYRNSYVDSDFGWILEENQSQYHAQFSTSEITVNEFSFLIKKFLKQ